MQDRIRRGSRLIGPLVLVALSATVAAARTPTPTDGPSPTVTSSPPSTPTGTPPPPVPRAVIAPNPARSGQRVTLDGRLSDPRATSPHWLQTSGDVAVTIQHADQLVASFDAPSVAAPTVIEVTLQIAHFDPAITPVYSVTILPADAVQVVIGKVFGVPGGTVVVPVTLNALGLQVGSLRHMFAFTPIAPVVALPDGTPDCEPAPGTDSATFEFLPSGCTPGDSCERVRAVLSAAGGFPDTGPVYQCRVTILELSSTSCTHALSCAGADATDDTGAPLSPVCTDGAVTGDYALQNLDFAFHSDPAEPGVGDNVTVTFSVFNGLGGIPQYTLIGAAPYLSGPFTVRDTVLSEVSFPLTADCPGVAELRLSVNYETKGGCEGNSFFEFKYEVSPTFLLQVHDAPAFRITGVVDEFPGCGGRMRGVQVRLEPLGRSTVTSTGPDGGLFAFDSVPPGDYTVHIDSCNPYGCWPPRPVHVGGSDASVGLCPEPLCETDCNGDSRVQIDDLLTAVGAALGDGLDRCRGADTDGSGAIEIAELIHGVHEALEGCRWEGPR